MTKGEQTRRGIVQKAAPIFNQKGYEGTSLSDLMRATGLQKGGLYRHFASKEDLAAEVFDYSWDKARSRRLDGVEQLPDHVDRLKRLIDNFVDQRSGLIPGGCPLMNTAVDADDGNEVLRARVKKAFRSWTGRLCKVATEGIAKRQLKAGVDPARLATLIVGSLEGALLMSRLENNDEPLQAVREHLNEYLETKVRLAHSSPRQRTAR